MNATVQKEIRLLLPAWSAAVLLAIVPLFLAPGRAVDDFESMAVFSTFGLAAGVLLLSLSSFGRELSAGTFSILLAQPVPRRRTWNLKSGLLAGAVLLVVVMQVLTYSWRVPVFPPARVAFPFVALWGLIGLAFYSGSLWTTLLLRQVTAAFWFTVFIPAAMALAVLGLLDTVSEPVQARTVSSVLVVYSIAGWLWARRQFLRAQDVQWTGGIIALPGGRSVKDLSGSTAGQPKRRPLRALIGKELQSHFASLLLASILLLLHIAAIMARKIDFDPSPQDGVVYHVLRFWWLLWLALPGMVGSTAVAEERNAGTWESQLCLPASRSTQFGVKLMVALALGIVLGGVMPWVMESIGSLAGLAGGFPSSSKPAFWVGLKIFCLISAGIALVSFYASSLTSNLLQSLGASVVIGFGLIASGVWLRGLSTGQFTLWRGPLINYIGVPCLIVAVAWLAFRNLGHLQIGWKRWVQNALALLVVVVAATTVTVVTWNRAWELVTTLEPSHGVARLSGSVPPKVAVIGFRPVVLLPGGRIWAAESFRFKELDESESYRRPNGQYQIRRVRIPVPTGGTFIEGRDWRDLAGTLYEAAAIRSDGSLWRITSRRPFEAEIPAAPIVERMDANSNWKTVIASGSYFLALKHDGTLWGWGNNSDSQLGISTPEKISDPIRVGHDSDWAAVFASPRTAIGVKRDGSVWRWGATSGIHGGRPEPRRWNLNGTEWRWLWVQGSFEMGIKHDGTLWAGGEIPYGLFDKAWSGAGPGARDPRPTLQRVGDAIRWSQISFNWDALAGLTTNGTLLINQVFGSPLPPFFWGDTWAPSEYSDWIATGTLRWAELVALAADGTLCSWTTPWKHRNALLGPTRKPLWSVNVLEATTTPGTP